MAGTSVEPISRIPCVDPAPDLQSSAVSCQRRSRCFVVARPQLDHVTADKPIFGILPRKPLGGLARHEVFNGLVILIGQRATDDLLDLAVMEVDTGPKFGHRDRFLTFWKLKETRTEPVGNLGSFPGSPISFSESGIGNQALILELAPVQLPGFRIERVPGRFRDQSGVFAGNPMPTEFQGNSAVWYKRKTVGGKAPPKIGLQPAA